MSSRHVQHRGSRSGPNPAAASDDYQRHREAARAGLTAAGTHYDNLITIFKNEIPDYNKHKTLQGNLAADISGIRTRISRRRHEMEELNKVIHHYGQRSPTGAKAITKHNTLKSEKQSLEDKLQEKEASQRKDQKVWEKRMDEDGREKNRIRSNLLHAVYRAQREVFHAKNVRNHNHNTDWQKSTHDKAQRLLTGPVNPMNNRPSWELHALDPSRSLKR